MNSSRSSPTVSINALIGITSTSALQSMLSGQRGEIFQVSASYSRIWCNQQELRLHQRSRQA